MNEDDRKAVETMLENSEGRIGYAYLYPSDGGKRKEIAFEMTPENIAQFIGAHPYDAEKIILTDMCDRLILETARGFIDRCPDQELCQQTLPILAPIQMGETEAKDFPYISRELFDEYGQWEDEMATAAELEMF